MSTRQMFLLSLLGGVLLFLSWPTLGFPALLFFAFVPLLRIEQEFSKGAGRSRVQLFGWSYLTFFIWNLCTTFWVCNASMGGGAMAILANSFLMSGTFWIFHVVKGRLIKAGWSARLANWTLPIFWIAFEHFHLRWELTWPWLTLGNAFASVPSWVQWYEITGTSGGSLWVLAVNLFALEWLNGNAKKAWQIALLLLAPIALSLTRYYTFEQEGEPLNITVVQPNIDPYSEKFNGLNYKEQLEKMLELAKQKTDSTTDYLVFPETALTEDIWENDFTRTGSYIVLRDFMKDYPQLKVVVGATSWRFYDEGDELTETSRKFKKQEGYYDAFNTAFYLTPQDSFQLYHKSKLVPGVERMPYPSLFGFLESLSIDLGGISGSLGTQEDRGVFRPSPALPIGEGASPPSGETGEGVAPVICYESIFGEFVTGYIQNGASIIFIITNDGWWGNTPGYEQHLIYGGLRAIETRRSIARSANTGISCFINQRGDIRQATDWWVPDVISGVCLSRQGETFYVKFGDLISHACLYLSLFLLISSPFIARMKFGVSKSP